MDQELKQYLIEMEARLKVHTNEAVERVETSLLTEFHKWASPVDMRARTHAAGD